MRFTSLFAVLGVCAVVCAIALTPPWEYPVHRIVLIEAGQSVRSVGSELESVRAVRSSLLFAVFARSMGGVQAGSYDLGERSSVVTLAYRFATGDTGRAPVTVTVPEGYTVREIEKLVEVDLPDAKEGFLFPDTYEFLPGTPPAAIVARMEARYEEKVAPLRAAIAASGHSEKDIITMASILEKEARQPETMRVVAGILWKRLALGMPLQVDAVFGYIKGVDTFHPSLTDLELDSPYNTYKYAGLPPGPINNPGLSAMEAALEPTKTPYLYYLTGKDGAMHYARTFDQHIDNRKYLR